jgi:hypothetical protein
LEKIRQTYLSRRKHKYNKNEHISP